MLKMTATQQLATSLAIIFALLYAAVTTIRSESIEDEPGDQYLGVPLGALHLSADGTSAEVYAADEFTIVFNHFYHNPLQRGCTAMMIGPARSDDTENVVESHGVLLPLSTGPAAKKFKQRRLKRRVPAAFSSSGTSGNPYQFQGWPLEFDHLLMAPPQSSAQQEKHNSNKPSGTVPIGVLPIGGVPVASRFVPPFSRLHEAGSFNNTTTNTMNSNRNDKNKTTGSVNLEGSSTNSPQIQPLSASQLNAKNKEIKSQLLTESQQQPKDSSSSTTTTQAPTSSTSTSSTSTSSTSSSQTTTTMTSTTTSLPSSSSSPKLSSSTTKLPQPPSSTTNASSTKKAGSRVASKMEKRNDQPISPSQKELADSMAQAAGQSSQPNGSKNLRVVMTSSGEMYTLSPRSLEKLEENFSRAAAASGGRHKSQSQDPSSSSAGSSGDLIRRAPSRNNLMDPSMTNTVKWSSGGELEINGQKGGQSTAPLTTKAPSANKNPAATTSAPPSAKGTTPLFWVIKDPREARRNRLLHLRKRLEADAPESTTTTTTTPPPFIPFDEHYELPKIRDKLVTFTLTNGAKITQYKWVGLYNQCTRRHIPLVSLRDVDPPREEKIMPFSGWSHNVTSYRLHILNCNTILVPSFHYDGRNTTRNTHFFVGIGQFPEAVERQVKAIVVGTKAGEPLRDYKGEDVLLHLPRTYRTFDIDFISIYNTDEKKSYGHVAMPSLLVPPCSEDDI